MAGKHSDNYFHRCQAKHENRLELPNLARKWIRKGFKQNAGRAEGQPSSLGIW